MNGLKELHVLVDDLDGNTARYQLHVLLNDLNDEQVIETLKRMRSLRGQALERWGFSF